MTNFNIELKGNIGSFVGKEEIIRNYEIDCINEVEAIEKALNNIRQNFPSIVIREINLIKSIGQSYKEIKP